MKLYLIVSRPRSVLSQMKLLTLGSHMINEIGLSVALPPSKSRFIWLCLEMQHLQRHSDAVPPVALADYPLTFRDKSKEKRKLILSISGKFLFVWKVTDDVSAFGLLIGLELVSERSC